TVPRDLRGRRAQEAISRDPVRRGERQDSAFEPTLEQGDLLRVVAEIAARFPEEALQDRRLPFFELARAVIRDDAPRCGVEAPHERAPGDDQSLEIERSRRLAEPRERRAKVALERPAIVEIADERGPAQRLRARGVRRLDDVAIDPGRDLGAARQIAETETRRVADVDAVTRRQQVAEI